MYFCIDIPSVYVCTMVPVSANWPWHVTWFYRVFK